MLCANFLTYLFTHWIESEEEQLVKYQKNSMALCQIKGPATQYFSW